MQKRPAIPQPVHNPEEFIKNIKANDSTNESAGDTTGENKSATDTNSTSATNNNNNSTSASDNKSDNTSKSKRNNKKAASDPTSEIAAADPAAPQIVIPRKGKKDKLVAVGFRLRKDTVSRLQQKANEADRGINEFMQLLLDAALEVIKIE